MYPAVVGLVRRYIPPWWHKEVIRWQDTLIEELNLEGVFTDGYLSLW